MMQAILLAAFVLLLWAAWRGMQLHALIYTDEPEIKGAPAHAEFEDWSDSRGQSRDQAHT